MAVPAKGGGFSRFLGMRGFRAEKKFYSCVEGSDDRLERVLKDTPEAIGFADHKRYIACATVESDCMAFCKASTQVFGVDLGFDTPKISSAADFELPIALS
jgi:hypothetical protein